MSGSRRAWWPILFGLMIAAAGCASDTGGGGGTQDAGHDTGGDGGQDAGNDPTIDQAGDPQVDQGGQVCGDGSVTGTELCDGSATNDGCTGATHCNGTCTACVPDVADVCGDNAVTGSEACDGSASPTGCTGNTHCNGTCTQCVANAADVCGDAAVTGSEVCDGSAADTGCTGSNHCNGDCTACVPDVCGDGLRSSSETCDGSADVTGCTPPKVCADDCSACVAHEAGCGDGAVNGDEVCDASSLLDTGCTLPERCNADCSACAVPPRCGDGAVNGDEDCDSTASDSSCGDGQTCNNCACVDIPATCGDHTFNSDVETCDGSDTTNDGCNDNETCAEDCSACNPNPPADCGDGEVGVSETCDQSATDNGCDPGFVCNADCTACTQCGNGTLEDGEACDWDAIFRGDPGDCDILGSADAAGTEYCTASCECQPLQVSVESYSALGSAVFYAFDVDLSITDHVGWHEADRGLFALLFLDTDTNIIGFLNIGGGVDFLVYSELTAGDGADQYDWHFQAHMPFGPPDGTEYIYLVLITDTGEYSNPVLMARDDQSNLPTDYVLQAAAACDEAVPLTQCAGFLDPDNGDNFECIAGTCTDLGTDANFDVTDASVTKNTAADTLTFTFTITNDVNDLLPYWTAVFLIPGDSGPQWVGGFAPWDDSGVTDVTDGSQTATFTLDTVTDLLGVPVSDIQEVAYVVHDLSHSVGDGSFFGGNTITPTEE